MADTMSDKKAEAAKALGELLSMLLPNCEFVLIAKPEMSEHAFSVSNVEPNYCLELVKEFVERKKRWLEMPPNKPN